ncbi:hypothetical protein RRG08_006363 [Elysia crispata]|uniref:Uncharacterized protein n=1 Tax=Elysia crispata TaxID=231223 RepID=A0AAE1DDF3_9GAST|nr:hypothetical protein RRG08_006363 [Elysia crispata]
MLFLFRKDQEGSLPRISIPSAAFLNVVWSHVARHVRQSLEAATTNLSLQDDRSCHCHCHCLSDLVRQGQEVNIGTGLRLTEDLQYYR